MNVLIFKVQRKSKIKEVLEMIFISHTSKDKPIIEPIAISLAKIYGQENVFYDSWSIQPGDGIIDKMNSGLEKCKFFFFFVSRNSLKSKMVSLEWQNAILKTSNEETKLIPVKIDDCLMPAILLQSLYIDIFGKGLEVGIRQMVDVINHENTFSPDYQTFENIRGFIKYHTKYKCTIEFRAVYYLEPISRYCILLDNPLDMLNVTCKSDGMRSCGQQENLKLNNGEIHNALFESVARGTTPNFPYVIEIATKDKSPLKIAALMRAENDSYYKVIPSQMGDEK